MAYSAPASPPYRVYRLVRSPVVAVAVVLLYTAALLAFREGDEPIGFTALRGEAAAASAAEGSTALSPAGDGDDKSFENAEAVDEWDPLPSRIYRKRGAVKGGVEIYPLKPSQQVRSAPLPLVPEVAEIEGTLTAWKMPRQYARGGGEAMKGLYVVFHGCNHGPLDWFDLPEERTIVSSLVKAGYAVVAPASRDRESGCWEPNMGNKGDVLPVKAVLWRWYRDWSISPTTPLFLFGASSGGIMATYMASKGGFTLCDKKTTYVQVSGVLSQVSWGVPPSSYGRDCPPIAFMPMPKGDAERDQGDDPTEDVPQVFGDSRKIPAQMSLIAHYVRKSGGRPRMLLLPLGELPLEEGFFSDRVYEISPSQSAVLYNALVATHAVTCESGEIEDDNEPGCFLAQNPRGSSLALDTLVATYLAILESEPEAENARDSGGAPTAARPANTNGNGTAEVSGAAPEAMASPQLFNRRRAQEQAVVSGPLPILQPVKTATTTMHQQEQQQQQQQRQQRPSDDLKDDPRPSGGGGSAANNFIVAGATGGATMTEKEERGPTMTEHHATEVFRELLNVAWGGHELSADFVGRWEKWLWKSCGDICRPWPSR